ncbi:MAG: hypothetical protein ACREJQ_08255 [bacterium]
MKLDGTKPNARIVIPKARRCGICGRRLGVKLRRDGRPLYRGACLRKYHPHCAKIAERRRRTRYMHAFRRGHAKGYRLQVKSLAADAAHAFPEMARLAGRGFGVEFSRTPTTFIGQALTVLWLRGHNPGVYAEANCWSVAVTLIRGEVRTRRVSQAPPGVELHLVLAALLIQLLDSK